MQIHELNTGTPASSDYLAMDTGSDTYKATPGNVVPAYTSGDDASPSAWTTVTAVAAGLSFSTLINRITSMMKNVRFLYGLLGTTDISGIGGGTVTGAISALNSKLSPMYVIDTVQCLGDGAAGKHTYAVTSVSGYTPVGIVGYAASGGYEGSRGIYQLNLVGTEINIGWENAVASNRGLNVNVLYLHT